MNKPHTDKSKLPQIIFHDRKYLREYSVEVRKLLECDKYFECIVCYNEEDNHINVKTSSAVEASEEEITEELAEIIIKEYRRQCLKEEISENTIYNISFFESENIIYYLADIIFFGKTRAIKDFELVIYSNGKILFSMPKWMNGPWNNKNFTWEELQSIVINEIKIRESSFFEVNDNNQNLLNNVNQSRKDTTSLGRVKNASGSPLRFYPNTVLRVKDAESKGNKKKIFDLSNALIKGVLGGIGPFEINLLVWISKLRYVSTTMLLDLIEGGYVAIGWRNENITQTKLQNILSRMNNYDLIDRSHFVTVDDDGFSTTNARSSMQILTLGWLGNTMLRELGKNAERYSQFDVIQDGNTVKRFLAANQWLIYWLAKFGNIIKDNYQTARTVYQKGTTYSGAKIYSTVRLNDITMIAEPIRRVDSFEYEDDKLSIRGKLKRLIEMFNHLDQLYYKNEEVLFMERPIINLVCEDDEHISEVWNIICDIVESNPEQQIIFTTDLRIFNVSMENERFILVENNALKVIDMNELLGLGEVVII